MVLKRNNAIIAPLEAALIHICSLGSVCLNSAAYGGLDTLAPIATPSRVHEIKASIVQEYGPTAPLQEKVFDHGLLTDVYDLVKKAALADDTCSPPTQVLAAIAIYAALPSRGLHRDLCRSPRGRSTV